MSQDFRASILAQLDTRNIQRDIDNIGRRNIRFSNISFDTTQLINTVQAALNNHRFNVNLGNVNINSQGFNQQAQTAGNSAGQSFTSGFNRAIQGINLSNTAREIDKVKKVLTDYNFDTHSIDVVTNSLATMRLQIDSVKTAISSVRGGGNNIRLTIQGTDEMKRAVQVIRELKAGENDVSEVSRTFTQNFAQQETQIQRNSAAAIKYGDKIAALVTKFTEAGSASRLFDSTHIDAFNNAIQGVLASISQLETATAEESTILKSNIDSQINAVSLLATGFHNVETAQKSEETQIQRNSAAITGYLSKLESIQGKYTANSNNPIINPTHLQQINTLMDRVLDRISTLERASSLESITIKANINSDINQLNLLVQSLQRVESAERSVEAATAKQFAQSSSAISKYKSIVESLSAKAFDANSIKPITNADNIAQLEAKFTSLIMSINNLKTADSSTFMQMKANVENEIASVGLLISSMQNAEYAASQLRAKPVEVLKAEEMHKLQAFVAEINKSGVSLSSFKTDISGLKTTLEGVTNSAQLKSYLNMLATAKSEFRALKQEAAQYASATDVSILKSKMETWLLKNTKAAKTYGATIRQLIAELDSMSAKGGVLATDNKRIANSFKEIDAAAGAAGLKGRTFFQSLGKAAQSLGRYFGVSTIIYRSIATLKQGIKDVIDLDTALVDLQKTAKATSEELSNFYYDANEQAKQFGVTTKEIIQSTADWSRLGYNLNDSQTMAQVSSIFKSISPGMDIDAATSGLVSTMKAFDIEASNALDGIASKINAIGNSQALANKDIVEFLTRSSSAMAEANNSLEQTIALGTAATEITQDAASVGNALKTISMRIRGYDEETESFTEDVEVLSGKIANLTKTAKSPGGISLFTDASKTEYKSTYDLLKDISEIYNELDDKTQARLLETLGAKRQGNIVAAILNNFDAAESSMTTMAQSAGSAMNEMGIIEESLAYKLNALKETGVGLFQNLFDRGDLGVAIELLTGVITVIDKITEGLGLLGTTLATIGIVKFIKNFDQLVKSCTLPRVCYWSIMGKKLS